MTVNTPARVFFGPGFATWADCIIKDLSPGGAKLVVDAVYNLPNRLVLLDYAQDAAFDALRHWRRWDMAGVSFTARHDLTALDLPQLRHVREAWLALKPAMLGA